LSVLPKVQYLHVSISSEIRVFCDTVGLMVNE
jgi:hypothetical protein